MSVTDGIGQTACSLEHYLVISVFSATEMPHEIALYKFAIDIDIDIRPNLTSRVHVTVNECTTIECYTIQRAACQYSPLFIVTIIIYLSPCNRQNTIKPRL